ncbi:BMP family lipoprotein [Dehalogenimonas alkenigignens]|uniref:Putative ABC-type transport system, periplasmic component/surface lipoprotein n=1 Tax=Dehalogenimonas alkenigignens TaxID=1217799 RepID=A0A0W0GG34_9CHLR|nr:BMP family ABC transporter substrate-binding protein [Dehalogenimonas alkenigignens]KTB47514.1 putative ABC-type transport system, periplasmic component/surface lipoprotein [Dehalogenimonas alkenigignens]
MSGESVEMISSLRRLSFILIAFVLILPSASCAPVEQQTRVLNVGLLLGSGGLGDRSFNDSAYAGLLEAQTKYNIRFETIASGSKEANIDALRLFARSGYDLIIAVAFENLESLKIVAAEFPSVKFAGIDFELTAPNVSSIVYREQEADFLMGALAAMLTQTKKICVIGGTDIPAIRRIMSGFTQGAAHQDPSVTVITDFAGTFADPQVGLALALKRYSEGVDIIHNAASRTGLGIIQAAQQTGKLTTGTSGDQRYLAPGNVVGNRPKRVDTAVLLLVEEVKNEKFTPGTRSLGLKENGFSLGPFDTDLVTPQMLARLDELKQQITGGLLTILTE